MPLHHGNKSVPVTPRTSPEYVTSSAYGVSITSGNRDHKADTTELQDPSSTATCRGEEGRQEVEDQQDLYADCRGNVASPSCLDCDGKAELGS